MSLSDQEKSRIKEEILFREQVRQEVQAATQKEEKRNFLGFLNSTFTVTVVGGLLLAVVASRLQTGAAYNDQLRSRSQVLQDKKFDLLVKFSDLGNSFLENVSRFRQDYTWLTNNKASTAITPDNRTREQIQKEYEELRSQIAVGTSPIAITSQISALYDSEEIRKAVEDFNAKLESLPVTDPDESKWKTTRAAYRDAYKNLIKVMASEVKRLPNTRACY